jgi:hypothetical protein
MLYHAWELIPVSFTARNWREISLIYFRLSSLCYLTDSIDHRERLGLKPLRITLIRIILVSDLSGLSGRIYCWDLSAEVCSAAGGDLPRHRYCQVRLVLLILDFRRWSSANRSSFAYKSSAAIADLHFTSVQVWYLWVLTWGLEINQNLVELQRERKRDQFRSHWIDLIWYRFYSIYVKKKE